MEVNVIELFRCAYFSEDLKEKVLQREFGVDASTANYRIAREQKPHIHFFITFFGVCGIIYTYSILLLG